MHIMGSKNSVQYFGCQYSEQEIHHIIFHSCEPKGDVHYSVLLHIAPCAPAGFGFGPVLHALRRKNRIRVQDGQIEITSGFLARDQYSTLTRHALDLQANNSGGASSRRWYYCPDCSIKGNSMLTFQGHLKGKKHFKQMSLKYLKNRR